MFYSYIFPRSGRQNLLWFLLRKSDYVYLHVVTLDHGIFRWLRNTKRPSKRKANMPNVPSISLRFFCRIFGRTHTRQLSRTSNKHVRSRDIGGNKEENPFGFSSSRRKIYNNLILFWFFVSVKNYEVDLSCRLKTAAHEIGLEICYNFFFFYFKKFCCILL